MMRIYIICGIVAAAILGLYMVFSFGRSYERTEWELKYAEAAAAIKNLETKAAEVNNVVVTKYVNKIQYVDKVKIQEVTKFVSSESDKSCVINNGFVNVHNAAAAASAIVASEADKDQSQIKLSNVASVVVDNYAECNKTKLQLESLQGWVRDQQTLWNTTK
jgi:hypothetical protein